MMAIIEITRGGEFLTYSSEQRAAILSNIEKFTKRCGVSWPEDKMLGTHEIGNKQLVFCELGVSVDDFHDSLTFTITDERDEPILFDGEELEITLDWQVLANEFETVDQSLLLPYFSDVPIIDEEGNVTEYEPVTDLTNKLQIWAGRKWKY